jgi:hypothetical protein
MTVLPGTSQSVALKLAAAEKETAGKGTEGKPPSMAAAMPAPTSKDAVQRTAQPKPSE